MACFANNPRGYLGGSKFRSIPFEWQAALLPATDIYKAKWQEREREGDSVRTELFSRVSLRDGQHSLEDWLIKFFGARFASKVMKELLTKGKAGNRMAVENPRFLPKSLFDSYIVRTTGGEVTVDRIQTLGGAERKAKELQRKYPCAGIEIVSEKHGSVIKAFEPTMTGKGKVTTDNTKSYLKDQKKEAKAEVKYAVYVGGEHWSTEDTEAEAKAVGAEAGKSEGKRYTVKAVAGNPASDAAALAGIAYAKKMYAIDYDAHPNAEIFDPYKVAKKFSRGVGMYKSLHERHFEDAARAEYRRLIKSERNPRDTMSTRNGVGKLAGGVVDLWQSQGLIVFRVASHALDSRISKARLTGHARKGSVSLGAKGWYEVADDTPENRRKLATLGIKPIATVTALPKKNPLTGSPSRDILTGRIGRVENPNDLDQGTIHLVRHPRHKGYWKADRLVDQKGLSISGWGARPIKDSDLDDLLIDVSAHGYDLSTQRNPSAHTSASDDSADAAALYETFHGVPSDGEFDVVDELNVDDTFAGLGALVEIWVIPATSRSNKSVKIAAPDPDKNDLHSVVTLASNPEGTQLYFIGGDQELDVRALGFDKSEEKPHMLIGVITEITYRTQKKFNQMKKIDYFHKTGEETGHEPSLVYDPINCQMSVVGGAYKVRDVGIVN